MDTVSPSGRRVRKFEGLAAVVATVLSSFLIGAAPGQDAAAAANVIPDDALRACVTDAMASDNVTPQQPGIITADDLANAVAANVSTLNCQDKGVKSLEGLSGLTSLWILSLDDNQISDLSPLAGLSNLHVLGLDGNQISDLKPLAGLSNLDTLSLSNNQVSDLSPLGGLSGDYIWLFLDSNQISDLTPLAKIHGLYEVDLRNNQISDISPLAGLLAWLSEPTASTGPGWYDEAMLTVWLSGNEIMDASVLPAGFRSIFGDDGQEGVLLTDQRASATAVAGAVVPLPAVLTQSQYGPIVWSVVSGAATLNDDGTVVYPKAGSVVLAWHDASPYRVHSDEDYCLADGGQIHTFADTGQVVWCDWPDFSGQVTVTVGAAPAPSVPDSVVAKDEVKASTTGGAARLADGKDSYTLVTTVVDDNGTRLAGLAGRLSAQTPDGVTVSSFTDNGDGTYSVKVTSSDPGNYQIVILLDGKPVGDPVPVNFIGADIAQPSRAAGEKQSADGLGFLPGEKVTVTVHSDPIDLGTLTADENGKVSVSFEVLASLGAGAHSVEFAGAVSGTVSVAFDVTGPTVDVNTGGTVAPDAGLLAGLVACLLVAGVALATTARARLRRRV